MASLDAKSSQNHQGFHPPWSLCLRKAEPCVCWFHLNLQERLRHETNMFFSNSITEAPCIYASSWCPKQMPKIGNFGWILFCIHRINSLCQSLAPHTRSTPKNDSSYTLCRTFCFPNRLHSFQCRKVKLTGIELSLDIDWKLQSQVEWYWVDQRICFLSIPHPWFRLRRKWSSKKTLFVLIGLKSVSWSKLHPGQVCRRMVLLTETTASQLNTRNFKPKVSSDPRREFIWIFVAG